MVWIDRAAARCFHALRLGRSFGLGKRWASSSHGGEGSASGKTGEEGKRVGSEGLKDILGSTMDVKNYNFPNALPYLEFRKGKRMLVCLNEQDVQEAKRALPPQFKPTYDIRGNRRAPVYTARARKALRARTLRAGKVSSVRPVECKQFPSQTTNVPFLKCVFVPPGNSYFVQFWPWDIPTKKMIRILPFKGRKRYKRWAENRKNIMTQMEAMPQKIAEYRANRKVNVSVRYTSKKKAAENFLERMTKNRKAG